MAYQYDQQFHKRKKRSNRILKAVFVIVVFIAIIATIVFIDWFINNRLDTNVVGRSSDATVQSSSTNIFRTPYFQFQTDDKWSEVESTEKDKFIYRSFDNQLVTHELIVEVNKGNPTVLGNERVSRVLPVTIDKNRLQTTGPISEHCRELVEDETNRKQQVVSYKEVDFQCNPDSESFLVVVGLIGKNEIIETSTDTGEKRTYKITYRDSTFYPNGRPLGSIINNFLLFR